MWWGVIGTSIFAFTLKYLGHSVPMRFLSHPRIQQINAFIPVALLSALVAVQTLTEKSRLVIDHRLAGVGVAIAMLLMRAPFPIVVLCAAVTSALLYHFI